MRPGMTAVLLLASALALGSEQGAPRFVVHYDVVLAVGDERHQVKSRAQVTAGGTLAVPMSRFRVDIDFVDVSAGAFTARVSVLERDGSGWLRLIPDPARVEGQLNAPVSFVLSTGSAHLDLAVAVAEPH